MTINLPVLQSTPSSFVNYNRNECLDVLPRNLLNYNAYYILP